VLETAKGAEVSREKRRNLGRHVGHARKRKIETTKRERGKGR